MDLDVDLWVTMLLICEYDPCGIQDPSFMQAASDSPY